MSASRPTLSTSPSSTRAEPAWGDGFVSEATLELLLRSGDASRAGDVLSLRDGRRLVLRDALRILGRRASDTDPYGFTGRVFGLRELLKRGATLSGEGARIGAAVYDVEYGYWLAASADESGPQPRVE
jgi:hypothetical protein